MYTLFKKSTYKISKLYSIKNNNPKMYITSSEYCVYTNNPTIMSVNFFKNNIEKFRT